MRCISYRAESHGFPCGQCMACRINRQRQWAARVLLEAQLHPVSSFATLTYSEEECPLEGTMDEGGMFHVKQTVRKDELRKFARRLRKLAGTTRYFGVSEYGDRTGRPHYHAVLFGFDPFAEELVRECWPYGHVRVDELTRERALYVAQYTLKKYGKAEAAVDGREPERMSCSRNPGIGAGYAPILARTLSSRAGAAGIAATGDIPRTVRLHGKIFPLDRYMCNRIRAELGIPGRRSERVPTTPLQPIEVTTIEERKARLRQRKKRKGTRLDAV